MNQRFPHFNKKITFRDWLLEYQVIFISFEQEYWCNKLYRFHMRSHDYRTLNKAKQKINFKRMSLVKNLNWASETGRTMPNFL